MRTYLAYSVMLAAVAPSSHDIRGPDSASTETMEGAPAVSMAMDLLTIKVVEATAATADVAATATVAMATEAAEKAYVDAVVVTATPNHGGVG